MNSDENSLTPLLPKIFTRKDYKDYGDLSTYGKDYAVEIEDISEGDYVIYDYEGGLATYGKDSVEYVDYDEKNDDLG